MPADSTIKHTTKTDITKFKKALMAWFNTYAIINKVKTTNLVLENLKQRKNKDLYLYYIYIKRFLEKTKEQNFWKTTLP